MKITAYPQDPVALCKTAYALGIVSSGYESRGRFAWKQLDLNASERLSFLFPSHDVLDHRANREFFSERKFTEIAPTHEAVRQSLRAAVDRDITQTGGKSPWYVVVDVSCMTRLLISATCYELAQISKMVNRQVVADFVYSCAEFGEVPDSSGPITVNGPVIPQLAGWPKNPSAPLGLVIGIGYEEDLALGVIEELEATEVWAFRPKDHDQRYEDEIVRRNKGLFDEIPPANMVRYSLFDAYSLYSSVEALIGLALNDTRLVVVPLGPKLFALVSSLATLRHYPNVGLWRVSSGENASPVQRDASGTILALRATFDT